MVRRSAIRRGRMGRGKVQEMKRESVKFCGYALCPNCGRRVDVIEITHPIPINVRDTGDPERYRVCYHCAPIDGYWTPHK